RDRALYGLVQRRHPDPLRRRFRRGRDLPRRRAAEGAGVPPWQEHQQRPVRPLVVPGGNGGRAAPHAGGLRGIGPRESYSPREYHGVTSSRTGAAASIAAVMTTAACSGRESGGGGISSLFTRAVSSPSATASAPAGAHPVPAVPNRSSAVASSLASR